MTKNDIIFVIPTYRLRDVGETIERYDEHFWRNGYSPKIILFDDSSVANNEKYYKKLEQTKTYNDVYYVGPDEKQEFTTFLLDRLKNKRLEPVVNNLFRPSYGGNRNFSMIYTLGNLVISSDDDMRPEGIMAETTESLGEDEVCRGTVMKKGEPGSMIRSFDIYLSFSDVLGKSVRDAPQNYEKGELVIDSSMDLETNISKGIQEENSLVLQKGKVLLTSIVKLAQTFRSGTNDFDALDYAELFLRNDDQLSAEELNSQYVLINFRPVITNKNWRMDSGVAGYDNRFGLPPFFPTRLRFEDYIFRLWVQQEGIAAAHVNSVQTHIKSNYMRDPLASEIFNEEIANLLKKKIKETVTKRDDLSVSFDYDGSLTKQDSDQILEKIVAFHGTVMNAVKSASSERRTTALYNFGLNLERIFYNFEPDFFQQNVSRLIDDEIGLIKSSIEIWPTLVEICYYRKDKKELPQTKVKNRKRG